MVPPPRRSTINSMSAQATELRRRWIRETAALAAAAHTYVRDTRDLPPEIYEQVEDEAWRRLVTTLERIGRPLRRDGVE